LRKRFERFCFKHRDKGIANLMLYLCIGSAMVYLMSWFDETNALYNALCYNRELILQGQVWRLFTYVLTYGYGDRNLLLVGIGLLCYYSLGRAMENIWGTLRFNLFYLCGLVLQDVFCLCFGGAATVSYLNLSILLAYATLYPSAHFLLFFIIPIPAWVLGLFDLAVTAYNVWVLTAAGFFPFSLFPLVALANYFLFFGKDVLNLFPVSWRANARRLFRKAAPKPESGSAPSSQPRPKVVPLPTAGSYQATTAAVKAPYTHKCTVCGRTDVEYPDLEFRYCSRCNGYHCYCQDHISNHTHIQ